MRIGKKLLYRMEPSSHISHKRPEGEHMKRALVYVTVILWMIALIQVVVINMDKNESITVQAIEDNNFSDVGCVVELAGRIHGHLGNGEQEQLLLKLAKELGITSGMESDYTEKSNGTVTSVRKNGANGITNLEYICILPDNWSPDNSTEDYIVMRVEISEGLSYGLSYQKLFNEIGQAYEIDGKASLMMTANYGRLLSLDEKNEQIEKYFTLLNVKEAAGNRGNDLFTVYGYTKAIEDWIRTDGKKINVNIAMSDNEVENSTMLHFGIPVLKEDY